MAEAARTGRLGLQGRNSVHSVGRMPTKDETRAASHAAYRRRLVAEQTTTDETPHQLFERQRNEDQQRLRERLTEKGIPTT